MGEVPAVSNMPTVSITSPQMCEDIQEGEAFKVVANYKNIALGSFTDPKSTFYDAPTRLTEQGEVIGHTHIACQLMSANSFNPENPPDAEKPDFFKGIDDPGETENGITTVEATVEAGELAQGAGCYRCCTMTGGANHQALGMPIAQRGTQDSCTFFSVGGANCGCSAQGGGQQGGGGQQEVKGGGGKGGGGKVQDGKGKGGKAPVQVGGKKVVKQIVKSGRQR